MHPIDCSSLRALALSGALLCAAPDAISAQAVATPLVPAEIGVGDFLGSAVAYDADTAVARSVDRVHVFERSDESWSEVASLLGSDVDSSSSFGREVDVSRDTLFVGAPNATDGDGVRRGAVYVFTRVDGVWTETQKLLASNGSPDDQFGFAVSVHDDRAIVGAPGRNSFGPDAGAAYVFRRQAGGWVEVAALVADDPAPEDLLGYSVAIRAGYALAGAPGKSLAWPRQGATYLFELDHQLEWVQDLRMLSRNPQAFAEFGSSVSASDSHFVVSAPLEDNTIFNDAGAAYLYQRTAEGVRLEKQLYPIDPAAGDRFGEDVSIVKTRIAVGAPGDDDLGSGSGSAYVFLRQEDDWVQKAKLVAPFGQGGDTFGTSVSAGAREVLVGAPNNSVTALNGGAAVVYEFPFLTTTNAVISAVQGGLSNLSLEAGEAFGGMLYLLVGSASGTEPGIALGPDLVLPLAPDDYLAFSIGSPNTLPYQNSLGLLDSFGTSVTKFTLPGGVIDPVGGLTLHHAYVVLDPVSGELMLASNAVELEILPSVGIFLEEHFDGDAPGWVYDNGESGGLWHFAPAGECGFPSNAAAYNNGPPTCDYFVPGTLTEGGLVSPVFTVPEGGRLNFRYELDLVPAPVPPEQIRVEILDEDSSAREVVGTMAGLDPTGVTDFVTWPIPSPTFWAGKSVRLRFTMNGLPAVGYSGWIVDDVFVDAVFAP